MAGMQNPRFTLFFRFEKSCVENASFLVIYFLEKNIIYNDICYVNVCYIYTDIFIYII